MPPNHPPHLVPWWRDTKTVLILGSLVLSALVVIVVLLSTGSSKTQTTADYDVATVALSTQQYDDVLDELCRSGTFEQPNRFPHLETADSTSFCLSPRGWPIHIGHYEDPWSIDADVSTPYVDAYAIAKLPDEGTYVVFMATPSNSGDRSKPMAALRPLEKYGIAIHTA